MAKRFELPILIAAVLVIPVIVLEEADVSDTWKTIGGVANWGIWLVFALEVLAMFSVVPSRWTWVRENPLEIAIVTVLGGGAAYASIEKHTSTWDGV